MALIPNFSKLNFVTASPDSFSLSFNFVNVYTIVVYTRVHMCFSISHVYATKLKFELLRVLYAIMPLPVFCLSARC